MTEILALLPQARRAGATSGGEYAAPCPWCGGRDRFRLWPSHPSGKPRYWCRRCNRRGDGISLVQELTGLGFREAATAIGQSLAPNGPLTRRRQTPPLKPPTATWQGMAQAVSMAAKEALWSKRGAVALDYLHRRGFADDTIRAVGLGYNASDRHGEPDKWGLPLDHRPVWVPQGITIPWCSCGSVWRLNVRRLAGSPKYCGPAGFGNALYGADGLRHQRPVVMVEGELDALAVAQVAGDVVTAIATGSTCGARRQRWVRLLAKAPIVLVAFDDDKPGDDAADWWLDAIPGSRRAVPEGDPADMLESRAGLRKWISNVLR